MSAGIEVKIIVKKQVLKAILLDKATTRHLIARFPMALPILVLYG